MLSYAFAPYGGTASAAVDKINGSSAFVVRNSFDHLTPASE